MNASLAATRGRASSRLLADYIERRISNMSPHRSYDARAYTSACIGEMELRVFLFSDAGAKPLKTVSRTTQTEGHF